ADAAHGSFALAAHEGKGHADAIYRARPKAFGSEKAECSADAVWGELEITGIATLAPLEAKLGSQDSEDAGQKFRRQASASTADENTSAARASAAETDKSNTHRFGEKVSVRTFDAEGSGLLVVGRPVFSQMIREALSNNFPAGEWLVDDFDDLGSHIKVDDQGVFFSLEAYASSLLVEVPISSDQKDEDPAVEELCIPQLVEFPFQTIITGRQKFDLEKVNDRPPLFWAQDVSNNLWSLVQLRSDAPAEQLCSEAVVGQLRRTVSSMNPQELTNSIWSLSQLKESASTAKAHRALVALANRLAQKPGGMIPQALANCLWACAELQDALPNTTSAASVRRAIREAVPPLASRAAAAAGKMRPQELSNCLWAAARMQQRVPEVLVPVRAVAENIAQLASEMKEQELINSLWAATCLADTVPEVRRAVPAISQYLPPKAIQLISESRESRALGV
ncbi:unnamed protein product, partial [Symbiodinium sp. KB8]